MPSIKNTIIELHKILNSTCDENTKVDVIELISKLDRESINYSRWDKSSIIIGFLIGVASSLLLFCTDATAEDASIDINLTSWHSDPSYNYNNRNYGNGYTINITDKYQISGGGFNNSYGKNSYYLIFNTKLNIGSVSVCSGIGIVTGYDNIESALSRKLGDKYSTSKEHGLEHDLKGSAFKYNYKFSPHFHPRNLNEFQIMILPNIIWRITKRHALQLTYVPAITDTMVDVAGLKYQYILED